MPSIINLFKESVKLIRANFKSLLIIAVIFSGVSVAVPVILANAAVYLANFSHYLGGIDLSVLFSLSVRYALSIEGLVIFYVLHKRGSLPRIIGSSMWARVLAFIISFIPVMLLGLLSIRINQTLFKDVNPSLPSTTLGTHFISGFSYGLISIVVMLAFIFADYLIVSYGLKAASAIGVDLIYLKKYWKNLALRFAPVVIIYSLIYAVVPAIFSQFTDVTAMEFLFIGLKAFDLLILSPMIIVYTISIFHHIRLSTDVSGHNEANLVNNVYIAVITTIILLVILIFANNLQPLLDPRSFISNLKF